MSKGKKPTFPELSPGIRKVLTKYVNSRVAASYLVQRANIILLSSEGKTNVEIGDTVQMHVINVGIWRQRFIDAYPVLKEIEESVPEKLEGAVKGCLSDIQRSGHPKKFTQEQVTKIIDLACTDPAESGYELSHWTLPALVKEIQKRGIAEQISAKSVSRFLKSGGIKAP